MSYQETRALSGIITILLTVVGYYVYAFGKYFSGEVKNGDIRFWAGAVFMFIGIGIAITILIQIVLNIGLSITAAKEEKGNKNIKRKIKTIVIEDEMDKLIELKTCKISYAFTGVGVVASLIAVLIGFSAAAMINIIYFSMCAGSMLEGIATIYYYKSGIKNAR